MVSAYPRLQRPKLQFPAHCLFTALMVKVALPLLEYPVVPAACFTGGKVAEEARYSSTLSNSWSFKLRHVVRRNISCIWGALGRSL